MNTTHRSISQAAPRAARLLILAFAAMLGLGTAWQARAQSPAGDPPDRVARLSDTSGKVWLYNADDNEWVDVDRNRPLTSGDRLATDSGSHAEITLGSTTLRLDEGTELDIVQLDDSTWRVHLQNGSVAARLRSPQSLAEFALETDDGQFRVQAVGSYRFDHADQTSDLTVYKGRAVFEGQNSALPLTTGQHAQFWLDAGGAAQYNMVAPARDAFAAWNDDRDRAESRPAALRYVSPEMTGAEDLDRYGQWEQSPDYGPLWIPTTVGAGWAPYSSGHWAWVRPWGWTWVDDAPWGFAPFHYGRWVNYRNTWCWAPGTYVARPVYAPALVAWIGGPRIGITIGVGAAPVGWFPLAPHEVYVPSYRTSPRYVREINITNVTNVTNITTIVNNVNGAADRRQFENRKFPNAVTVVPAGVLTGRQAVGPAAAQYRGDPRFRALVGGGRPEPVMTAPPVAAPPLPARLPEGRAPARPPFQGRAPGMAAGRPAGPETRPSADVRPPVGVRPGSEIRPAPGDVRPPLDSRPGNDAHPRPPGERPKPVAGPAAAIAPPAAVASPRPAAAPVPGADRRFDQRPAPGAPREVVPPRPVEAARPAERPRAEPPRAEPPRAEPPRAEPPRAEPPRAEPPRPAPETKSRRPETPPRDDKRDPKDMQK